METSFDTAALQTSTEAAIQPTVVKACDGIREATAAEYREGIDAALTHITSAMLQLMSLQYHDDITTNVSCKSSPTMTNSFETIVAELQRLSRKVAKARRDLYTIAETIESLSYDCEGGEDLIWAACEVRDVAEDMKRL